MILCDAGRALTLGSIPLALWTGHLSIAQLYLVALTGGLLFTFFDTAATACLPQVVDRQLLSIAAMRNQASHNIAELLGLPLGGVLFQTLGPAIPFLVDALSYAISVLSLLLI